MGASQSVSEKSIHEFVVKVKFSNLFPACYSLFLNTSKRKLMKLRSFGMLKDARGQDVDLSIYRGKVLLVVNVASKWSVFFSSLLRSSSLLEFLGFLFLENFELLAQWLYRFELYPADGALQQIQGSRSALLLLTLLISLIFMLVQYQVLVQVFLLPIFVRNYGLIEFPCFSLVNQLLYFVDETYVLISRT